jgi:hypothetical protein
VTARPFARRWAVVPALLLAAALLATGLPAGGGPAAPPPPPVRPAVASNPCPGSVLGSAFNGTLGSLGGPTDPGLVGGVAISYTYSIESRTPGPEGGFPTFHCLTEGGETLTNSSGAFAFAPTIPAPVCTPSGNGSVCTSYSGPFGPLLASPSDPPPAGYALSEIASTPPFRLAFVWELSSVTLTPGGTQFIVPPDDPIGFAATGWAANGSTTPLAATFNWTLHGAGWSFVGPPTGSTASVEAVPGAAVGTLTVGAHAAVGGASLVAPAISATLVAVSTAVEDAQLNRTTVDVDTPVSAVVRAVGAAGYEYSASVAPGLGLPAVPAACSTAPFDPGTVTVTCAGTLTYPSAGVAQPTANITNGYSNAVWFFPNVTVDPPPSLSVTPQAPATYAQSTVSIGVNAAPGTGAAPYARACLEVGATLPSCEATPGPDWTFSPRVGSPGDTPGRAWAVDADGTNRSVSFEVDVVAPLALGAIETAPAAPSVGVPVRLSVELSGGDLPLRFWWNATGVDGPLLAGTESSDGPATLTWVPTEAGPIAFSFAAEDGLGSVSATDRVVDVGVGAAVSVAAPADVPSGAVAAGTPIPLSWVAHDAAGGPAPTFSAPATLLLEGAEGPGPAVWVNATAAGPLERNGSAAFAVPSTAWANGVLALTVTLGRTGVYELSLFGPGLPDNVTAVTLTVGPDTDRVTLSDPISGAETGRSASTFWHVEDRFGNPAPGAVLTVRSAWGSSTRASIVVTEPAAGGTAGAWINYSAPGASGGTVSVYDAAGELVLGPIAIAPAAAAAPSFAEVALLALGSVALVGAGVAVAWRRRSSSRGEAPREEEPLRRLAEGRAAVVALLERLGPSDLAGLEGAWSPGPPPPELAEWIAALVTDGTLRATLGEDGGARFGLADRPEQRTRVTLDASALEEALRRRDEGLGEPPDGPS